jgi:hypothetical protein
MSKNGWIAFYNGKEVFIEKTDSIRSSFAAQKEAARLMRVSESKRYLIAIVSTEDPGAALT